MSSEADKVVLQPGQRIKPNVSTETAKKLVEKYFGYQVSKIKELNSYDDNNFYVEATKSNDGELGKFTFKVLNSMDSKKTGHVEAENEVMQVLHDKKINCPIPIKTLKGQTFEAVTISSETDAENNMAGDMHLIRLLTFVPGVIMYDVTITPHLLYETGSFIAKIDNLLKTYHHKALDNHNSVWMLSSTLELHNFVYVIKEESSKYNMVMGVLEAFKNKVVPQMPSLEKGVIHGDYNEQNIIVKPSSTDANEFDIHGLIDFGDLQCNQYVFEIATCVCYMMLECVKHNLDPFEGTGHVIAGYSKIRNIPQIELDLLRTLVACRLCQSLVLGYYTYLQDPGNEYLLTTAKTGWTLLSKVWNDTTDEQLQSIWTNIMSTHE